MALYSFFIFAWRARSAPSCPTYTASSSIPASRKCRRRCTIRIRGAPRSGCTQIAQGWAGGTRIGDSLAQFNREHAPRIVHSRCAILIMSDGYDTGEPQRLSDALAQLRRRARRVVWFNPLCNRPGYAPICQGMQAALPHLDLLAPGATWPASRPCCPG